MIKVTEKAREKVVELRKSSGYDETYNLRVSVEGGGCSGLSYKMDYGNQSREGDETFEDKGIKILVDKKSMLYLLGTTLDFSDGLNGKGFIFKNPNASRTCGCGESFAV